MVQDPTERARHEYGERVHCIDTEVMECVRSTLDISSVMYSASSSKRVDGVPILIAEEARLRD